MKRTSSSLCCASSSAAAAQPSRSWRFNRCLRVLAWRPAAKTFARAGLVRGARVAAPATQEGTDDQLAGDEVEPPDSDASDHLNRPPVRYSGLNPTESGLYEAVAK